MPFGAIPVIGAGAGAGSAIEGIQQNQLRQQDLLAQLMMHAQALQAQREYTQAYRQQMADARNTSAQAAKERADTAAQNLQRESLNAIPGGAQVPDELAQSPVAAGQTESRLPSRQYAGFSKIGSSQQPTVGGQTGAASTGEMQAQTKPGGFFKLPSAQEKQNQQLLDFRKMQLAHQEGNAANNNSLGWAKLLEATNRANQNAGQKGWKTEKVTDPATGKETWVRMNADTGEIKPFQPTEFQPPPNATTGNRLDSAEALLKTSQSIKQLIRQNADKLGPVMGRYNNVADFVGTADPEWSKLAGLIESYSKANMGVHGMRSNGGAADIKATLGQNRHTPESLIAALDGVNDFSKNLMQDNGRGARIPKDDATAGHPADGTTGTVNGRSAIWRENGPKGPGWYANGPRP